MLGRLTQTTGSFVTSVEQGSDGVDSILYAHVTFLRNFRNVVLQLTSARVHWQCANSWLTRRGVKAMNECAMIFTGRSKKIVVERLEMQETIRDQERFKR